MLENLLGVLKEHRTDLREVVCQLKEEESLLRLRRRWLMDLPLSAREQKRIDLMLPPDDKILPESLIREDDVNYDEIKKRIEMGFGAHKCDTELYSAQEDAELFNSRDIVFQLDDMTNKGLCYLTEILADGAIKFEKTTWRMKRTIKELLHKNDISKTKLTQVSRLLKDPKNFRENHSPCSTPVEVYRAAAFSVLEKLECFSTKALLAMRRRLTRYKGYTPSLLHPQRSGLTRDKLISHARKVCMKKLSELSEANNEPAEELSGALGVAGLTLKLIMDHTDVMDFRRFPPEIECLQNDIAKAIHLLNNPKKLSMIELKKVQLLLDPECNLSVNHLRQDVQNLLTEYLYECGDIDMVPSYLVETVNIINRRGQIQSLKKGTSPGVLLSPHGLMKEVIQKEVEHVLTVSAQAKGVLLDLLPNYDFDEDFAHAYVEDFEDEQVWDTYENYELDSCDFYSQTESMDQNKLVNTYSPSPTSKMGSDEKCMPQKCGSESPTSKMGSDVKCMSQKCESSDWPLEETNIVIEESGSGGNQYLEVQEACDGTTMIAYRFVGHLLDKLADIEGLELSQGDRLYLRGHSSVPEYSEDPPDKKLTFEFSEMWKDVFEG